MGVGAAAGTGVVLAGEAATISGTAAAAATAATAAGTAAAAGSTLATVSSIAGLVGSGVSAIGALSAGQANSKNAAFQAQIASNQAIADKNAAQSASAAGSSAAQAQGLRAAATEGAIVASQSASGVDVGSGSNLDVQKSQRALSLNDAQNSRYNEYLKAQSDLYQGTTSEAEAGLLNTEASQYQIAGDVGAAGSAIAGASSVGSKYASWLNTTGSATP